MSRSAGAAPPSATSATTRRAVPVLTVRLVPRISISTSGPSKRNRTGAAYPPGGDGCTQSALCHVALEAELPTPGEVRLDRVHRGLVSPCEEVEPSEQRSKLPSDTGGARFGDHRLCRPAACQLELLGLDVAPIDQRRGETNELSSHPRQALRSTQGEMDFGHLQRSGRRALSNELGQRPDGADRHARGRMQRAREADAFDLLGARVGGREVASGQVEQDAISENQIDVRRVHLPQRSKRLQHCVVGLFVVVADGEHHSAPHIGRRARPLGVETRLAEVRLGLLQHPVRLRRAVLHHVGIGQRQRPPQPSPGPELISRDQRSLGDGCQCPSCDRFADRATTRRMVLGERRFNP